MHRTAAGRIGFVFLTSRDDIPCRRHFANSGVQAKVTYRQVIEPLGLMADRDAVGGACDRFVGHHGNTIRKALNPRQAST